MNSRERVKTAFRHQEADRVPVGEMHIMSGVSSEILGREAITGEGGWAHWTMMDMIRSGRRDEYVERLKVDTLAVWRETGLDLINTELDPPKTTGTQFVNFTERQWTEVDPATGHWATFVYDRGSDTVHEVDSTEKQEGEDAVARHLDALESRGFAQDDSRYESTKYVIDQAGQDLFVMAKVPNLIPSGRSWYTLFMELMYTEPELAHRLCDLYLQNGLAVVRKYIELGVDCVMIATDWAYNSGPIFAPDKIREYLIPQVRAIADLCHANGIYCLKHTDGNIMKIADDFVGMGIDAYQSLEPNAGMDIGQFKQLYGDRITLMGNVDCARTLPFGTKEDVIAETRACIEQAAPGGGYILSSSNTIAHPIRADNFLTMIETAHKYGRY